MVKTKISGKRRRFSKSILKQKKRSKIQLRQDTGVRKSNPRKELLDEKLISQAIWECLKKGDSEGVIEVVQIYFEAVNKTKISEKCEIARSTIYHTLKGKNPTVKTLAKLIHACV